jgi:murein DD-endopeptidase MepM/ murein hydrolase activator NlpD
MRFSMMIMTITLLAACQGPANIPSSPSTTQPASSRTQIHTQAPPTEQTTSGQNLTEISSPILSTEYTPTVPAFPTQTHPPPNPENNSLPLAFPTPGEVPVSIWRPPLYQVPWAPGPHDHFYFVRPIAVDEVNWPLPDYRYGGIFPGTEIVHTGIDIDATRGTPVLAAGPGRVIWAGNGLYFGVYNPNDPYGIAVTIEHDFGYQGNPLYTVYAHMDRIDVVKGQRVETGTQLGIVGNTGFTTGPHLHFEVRIGKNDFFVTRNPELWLAPPEGWGILVGRLVNSRFGALDRLTVYVNSLDEQRIWKVLTYGPQAINSDDYYHENLVLSDLPAGDYQVKFNYQNKSFEHNVTIEPGRVSYFTFHQQSGFDANLPTPIPPEAWLGSVDFQGNTQQ